MIGLINKLRVNVAGGSVIMPPANIFNFLKKFI
jgi:hypothetical protein